MNDQFEFDEEERDYDMHINETRQNINEEELRRDWEEELVLEK